MPKITIRRVFKDDLIPMPLEKSGAVMHPVPEDGVIVSMSHSRPIYVPESKLQTVLETGDEVEFNPWDDAGP